MGKLNVQARGITKKLTEQQDTFAGGINLTEENVNLRDNESRLIENLTITPMGSISKRTGSVVLYDLGHTIKTLNGWFQEETRPNPGYVEGNEELSPTIKGLFNGVPKEEYNSFLNNNKFLGHFTYEKGETINHYIATLLGIYDQYGERVKIKGYDLEKEEHYDITDVYPITPVEDYKWDWIISVEESGYFLNNMIWVEDPGGWEPELDENGEIKKYYIDKIGELYNGQVNFDDERWWPVSPKGVVTLRWMKDKDTPWDPKEPNKYKPDVPYSDIGLETTIQNISDNEKTNLTPGVGYFAFGGNDNRKNYRELFKNNSQKSDAWWMANIKFSDDFISQKIGHRLDPKNQKTSIKQMEKSQVSIQSTQYKEETHIIMGGNTYTFKQGGFLEAIVPHKPTFEEYNLFKGNLAGKRNTSFTQSFDLNNQEALWNWDWTQAPQISDGKSKAIPMVLGIMGKSIPQSGKTLQMKAISVDSKVSNYDTKNKGWQFIWSLAMESGLESDKQLNVALNQRPTSNKYLNNFLVPATNTGVIKLVGTMNDEVKQVPKEIFPGLKLEKAHTDLFFLRAVGDGSGNRFKRYHYLYMEHLKPYTVGNKSSFLLQKEDIWNKDTRRGDNPSAKYSGSGMKGFVHRIGLKLPKELVTEMFYGNNTAASLDKLVFGSSLGNNLVDFQFQANCVMWSAGQLVNNGQIVAGAFAYLSFNQDRMKEGGTKWDKIKNAYEVKSNVDGSNKLESRYNLQDDLYEEMTNSNYFTSSPHNVKDYKKFSDAGRNYKSVGKMGGQDLDKTGQGEMFTIHGMSNLQESSSGAGGTPWLPPEANKQISINNWPNDVVLPWMKRYLVSPLPGTQYHKLPFDFWTQSNEDGGAKRTVKIWNEEAFRAIDWAQDLKNMENEILGHKTDDSVEYNSPLGIEPWTADDLNTEDIILNICLVSHWIPNNKWGKNYSSNSHDLSFYEMTGTTLKNDLGTDIGDENLFMGESYALMSGGITGSTNTFHISFPISPVTNIESFLPKMSSIMYINMINNSYIYKQQNFVWNTNSSIVFYSDINNFSYFPVIQTLELVDFPDEQIQAMQVYGDTALFFTKNRIYQLRGSSVEDFEIQLVNESVGSINPNTIKSVGNSLYFVSRKGAYRLRKGYSTDNYFLVEPIDTKIKGAYDPQTDTIHCTTEGEDYYIHITNRKETWIYNNLTGVWIKNHYGISEEIKWFRNINNETYYITDDFKICRFYNNSYRFIIDNKTTETDILDLQALYLDQFNRNLLLDSNSKPLPGMEEYFKLDKNGVIFGFNIQKLMDDNLGYPIVATWKSKEWSGQGDKVHHQKKFKELQLKFTRDSYAVGGWYQMLVDGNAIIDPEYKAIEIINGEYQIITKKTNYIEEPKDKSTLTRNPGTHLSRSFKVASGNYTFQNEDNRDITWDEGGYEIDNTESRSVVRYQYPLSSLWENTSEANMRKKQGKKGYTMQAVLSNDEQLPFGLKSCLLVYKLKKPK